MLEPITSAEEAAITAQLQRPPRGVVGSLTDVRAASPRLWRPDLDCPTAHPSRRRTTSRVPELSQRAPRWSRKV